MRQLFISIPAWGEAYVELAVKWTVPATLASLSLREADAARPTFLIHTDDRSSFAQALSGHDVRFFDLALNPTQRDDPWFAFKRAHREAFAIAPAGAIVTLLNSDIVVSRETFAFVDRVLAGDQIKTVVSVGIRTLIDGAEPPIGADAQALSEWIWSHRHPITKDCVWGKGRTGHPTILFFEHGGNEISMHGFHLTPMFVVKDRNLKFRGTIDDDMLGNYRDEEIYFVKHGELAVAELSPGSKTDRRDPRLDVRSVIVFGKNRLSKSHLRNFKNRIAVLGSPQHNHPAADQIIAGLSS